MADDAPVVHRLKFKDGRVLRIPALKFSNKRFRVWHGKRSASLRTIDEFSEEYIFFISSARLSKDEKNVRFEVERVRGPYSFDVPVAELEARLENAAGYNLHRRGKHKEASVHFTKAATLDPSFWLAMTNAASAFCLMGRVVDAEKAVAMAARHSVFELAMKVLVDDELTCLRKSKVILAQSVKGSGAAQIDHKTFTLGPVFSRALGQIAIMRYEDPGGAECTSARNVVILDANTGDVLSVTPLVSNQDALSSGCGRLVRKKKRAALEERRQRLNSLLTRYAFKADPGIIPGHLAHLDRKLFLNKAKMSVVLGPKGAKVFSAGKVIASRVNARLGGLDFGCYLPAASMMVLGYRYRPSHNDDQVHVLGIPIPRTP